MIALVRLHVLALQDWVLLGDEHLCAWRLLAISYGSSLYLWSRLCLVRLLLRICSGGHRLRMRMGCSGTSIWQRWLVFAFVRCAEGRIGEIALAFGSAAAEPVAMLLESSLIHHHALLLYMIRGRCKCVGILLLEVRLSSRRTHASRHLLLLLLFELLHVAAASSKLLVRVGELSWWLAVRRLAAPHRVAAQDQLVRAALEHHRGGMVRVLLAHRLVELGSWLLARLLEVRLVAVVRVVHDAVAAL